MELADPEPGTWTELSRRTIHEGYGRAVEEVIFELPTGETAVYEIKREPDTVAVLAMDQGGQIVMTRQYRPARGRLIYELPGGFLDVGEDPAAAAARELAEETGYVGLVTIGGQCYGDSYSTSVKYCAIATGCERSLAPSCDPGEHVAVEILSLADFCRLLRRGEIADTDLAYMALDWLGLLPRPRSSTDLVEHLGPGHARPGTKDQPFGP